MIILLAVFLLVTSASAQDETSFPLLIRNVSVVDPATRTITVADVEVNDGVIKAVRPRSTVKKRISKSLPLKEGRGHHGARPPGIPDYAVTEIDGTGLWLIPGLHDMHVHSFGNVAPGNSMDIMGTVHAAQTMAAAGVTGFLDLFSPEDAILTLRDKQRRLQTEIVDVEDNMADIYAAGPIFTCPGGHGTEYGIPTRMISTPAEAVRELADLAKRKPDVIKVVYDYAFTRLPTMDKVTMEAIVKGAAKRGIKSVIHIGTWQDAREAILAGASAITHVHSELIPADLVKLMHDRKVVEIPTMCVHSELVNLTQQPLLLDRPLLKLTASMNTIDAYRDTSLYDERTKAFLAYTRNEVGAVRNNVGTMYKGGVQLLAGTDCGNLGTFQGYSLHRELELMVGAGLSTWDALASATTEAGNFLGERVGFKVGDVANFVLLKGSPIEDIRNTQEIVEVFLHGRSINRNAILRLASSDDLTSFANIDDDLPSFADVHIKADSDTSSVVARALTTKWSKALIDEFISNSSLSSIGTAWRNDLDVAWGGKSSLSVEYTNGVMHAAGTADARPQQPALAGVSLAFPADAAVDVSSYTGIRIKVTDASGPLQLKLVTKGITNYDYHAVSIPQVDAPRTFEFPFTAFKQQWSAPVQWTGKDVNAIALWVSTFGTSAPFDFTIDAIEFY